MSDENVHRKRRSSFFPKPVEETSEKQLELFHNMNWVNEEKEKIISSSQLFGDLGKKTLKEYTENLKCYKQEYLKLLSNKQEKHIQLKEKLCKNKPEMDWEQICKGLTEVELEFVNNRPDYKCLAEKVQLLTLNMALVKRANYELHAISNAYNKYAYEEINKLQGYFVDKIIEDSGVGTSYNDSDTSSLTMDLSEDKCLNSDKIVQE